MKRLRILVFLIVVAWSYPVVAQVQEAEQLLLNVKKLAQLKQILNDMKTGYEIVSKGYTGIRDISKGNFNLHQAFLDGLMAVSPAVKNYKKAADIIAYEVRLVKEYKTAFTRFKQDKHFSADEITYIGKVYSSLFNQSLKDLDVLATVITAKQLRMSDEERLDAIDQLYNNMQEKLSFLRDFNNHTSILALQRERQSSDINKMKMIHGLN